jgi:hypothetical protein
MPASIPSQRKPHSESKERRNLSRALPLKNGAEKNAKKSAAERKLTIQQASTVTDGEDG